MAASRCVSHALHSRLLPAFSSSAPFSLNRGACRPLQCKQASRRHSLPPLRIVAQKPPDFYKVFAVAFKTARDALEAGTKLVPAYADDLLFMPRNHRDDVQQIMQALELYGVAAGLKESVPRPLAQAGVAVLGIVGSLYLLQSLFSIALFILAIGGVGYYLFYSLNKDDDERGGGGSSNGSNTDLTLEEARRIMEKYK